MYTSPDVNCDLETNALDALSILFGLAGFPEGNGTSPAFPCSGDVNQDGELDTRDALWMRLYLTQPV